jgi:hypothetical protein
VIWVAGIILEPPLIDFLGVEFELQPKTNVINTISEIHFILYPKNAR